MEIGDSESNCPRCMEYYKVVNFFFFRSQNKKVLFIYLMAGLDRK